MSSSGGETDLGKGTPFLSYWRKGREGGCKQTRVYVWGAGSFDVLGLTLVPGMAGCVLKTRGPGAESILIAFQLQVY